MSTETIEAEIAEFDRLARVKLLLEDGDDWRQFTSKAEHPDLFSGAERLERKLDLARRNVRLVSPVPRGSKPA
ncbi:MAG: hypothetical protein ACOH2J_22070 [Allorhizobium sp.]